MIIEIKVSDSVYPKLSIGKIFKLKIEVPDVELVFEKAKVLYFDDDVAHFEILDEKIGVDLDENFKPV